MFILLLLPLFSECQKRVYREGSYLELPPGIAIPGAPFLKDGKKGGRTYIKYGRPGEMISLSPGAVNIGKETMTMASMNGMNEMRLPFAPPRAMETYGRNEQSPIASNSIPAEYARPENQANHRPTVMQPNPAAVAAATEAGKEGPAAGTGGNGAPPTPDNIPHKPVYASNTTNYIAGLHEKHIMQGEEEQNSMKGNTYAQLGGGQFLQSLFGSKGGFSPLSFLLSGRGGLSGGAPFFVPVPIVVPPPPPPPPGPECYTNKSGFLCCNVTLEMTMEQAFAAFKAEGFSNCNVQKMASIVAEAAEKKFKTSFESVAAHKDFVAKINFAGDLNCKIEVDGKYILAYATPLPEKEVNIIDANSFFSGELPQMEVNATDAEKPTYIVYGPIR